jgi:hypothetical protein
MSFVRGSGAIEWLWNSNSYMTEGNETPIGALHADLTEKPEATVLRDMAKFAAAASPYLKNPKPPQVVVVTSQAAQFSVYAELQLAAQQNAVRALAYYLHQPCSILAENQIDKLGSLAPKLVILPSAQALRESTWQALLAYVKSGGNLLVTGPVSRDEHWHPIDRLTPLGIKGSIEPLTAHYSFIASQTDVLAPDYIPAKIALTFGQQAQQLLEYVHLPLDTSVASVPLEKGNLYWAAYPVELSEETTASSLLYEVLLKFLRIKPIFTSERLPYGDPLIYPIDLSDAVLYVVESEFDRELKVNINDSTIGEVNFRLAAQHAALFLIDKHTKQIVAKYGLP